MQIVSHQLRMGLDPDESQESLRGEMGLQKGVGTIRLFLIHCSLTLNQLYSSAELQ
jgi:hypothetical protein